MRYLSSNIRNMHYCFWGTLISLAIVSEKRCFGIFNSGIRIGNEINIEYKTSPYMNEELFYQIIRDEINHLSGGIHQ